MDEQERMRIFFAIDLSWECKEHLDRLVAILKPCCKKGSFTAKSNMHLTILFVGEVLSIEPFTAALKNLRHQPFDLVFDHIGRFPKRGGDVIYVGLQEANSNHVLLQTLYEKVTTLTNKTGITTMPAVFTPHITLGRNIRLHDEKVIETLNDSLRAVPCHFIVEEVTLMHSHRRDGVLVYTPIERVSL